MTAGLGGMYGVVHGVRGMGEGGSIDSVGVGGRDGEGGEVYVREWKYVLTSCTESSGKRMEITSSSLLMRRSSKPGNTIVRRILGANMKPSLVISLVSQNIGWCWREARLRSIESG